MLSSSIPFMYCYLHCCWSSRYNIALLGVLPQCIFVSLYTQYINCFFCCEGFADAATKPIDFPIAPAMAVRNLYERCGVRQEEVDMFEINEAFSGVAVAIERMLELDPAKTNLHGGAVSIGHPLGYGLSHGGS